MLARRRCVWHVLVVMAFALVGASVPRMALAVSYANMYRIYNPYTGEHLYTASLDEAKSNARLGWQWEGIGWVAPSEGDPVYRLYNPYSGDHHYTLAAAERDWLVTLGWRAEGIGWMSDPSGDGTPVLRQFNPYAQQGAHNFTTSREENDHLATLGWHAEGTAWYASKVAPQSIEGFWLADGRYVGSDARISPSRRVPIRRRMRANLDHGPKPADKQRYIVLHDTEGTGSGAGVIDWWASNGNLVAAHFVVDRDGTIWQCVELDRIAHHAGYGDRGHNRAFGISEDGRDDMRGVSPIGSWAPDYAMNAWSVGIEMVHVGGGAAYTEAQLASVDELIAYIDDCFGTKSAIIDHKAWRSGNSDTSPEFAGYLRNYQRIRRHR